MFFGLLFLFGILACCYAFYRALRGKVSNLSIALFFLYGLSFLPFALGLLLYNRDYTEAIDIVEEHYSPFGGRHVLTLVFYFVAYQVAAWLLWRKGASLPPLTKVLSLVFILIGTGINGAIILQAAGANNQNMDAGFGPGDGVVLFLLFPIVSIMMGLGLLYQAVVAAHKSAFTRSYKSPLLNGVNQLLLRRLSAPVWPLIFLLPVLLICTLILILFGQDANSLVKVFTDTTTWVFSQKTHPPALDHRGHYLCTVAARGHPKTVKPILIGCRQGRPIIVNRQLQIANAFEELVQDVSPRAHRVLRRAYDRWGYNLSLKINTEKRSNAVYRLMKPLEWTFLLCLYAGCTAPEEKIRRQYRAA